MLGRRGLEDLERVGVEDRADRGGRPERTLHDGGLLGGAGIADDDLHHEPVDLRLGQRVGALGLDRVLGRHHEERAGHRVALAADRDLALLHDLEQRGLDLRRGAVDLVGEQEVAEHRAQLGVEVAGRRAVDPGADEVRGDEVGRELDAPERGVEGLGEGADRERLGEAGDALEQQVAAGEQGDEHALEHRVLADDHAPDLEQDGLGGRARVVGPGGGLRRPGVADGFDHREPPGPAPGGRCAGCRPVTGTPQLCHRLPRCFGRHMRDP